MVERDIDGVLFLKRELTIDRLKQAIETLKTTYPGIGCSCTEEKMLLSIFNKDEFNLKYDQFENVCYYTFNDIEFTFTNWENSSYCMNMWGGRQQVHIEIWSDTGAWQQFIDEPMSARDIIGPLSIMADGLGAYLGFAGHELCLLEDDESGDLDYLERVLYSPGGGYSTYFLDEQLVNDIGTDLLGEWHILKQYGSSIYFASLWDPPFVTGLGDRYRTAVGSSIMDRLQKEYD
jgi:hypothetical protein